MSKLILFNLMTLDGFVAGPNGEIDWHNVDDEFNAFAIEQLGSAGGLIFGRVTYELMAGYWPTPAATTDDPVVAGKMNELPKIVFSRTLDRVDWSNSRLVTQDAVAEATHLRSQPGKDLFIFGSANLAATFARAGLIDEYRIMISPVVLGRGQPLFQGVVQPQKLRLLRTRSFENGNVLLYYAPDQS